MVDGANETAGCLMVDIQIRPEPMGECIAGKLWPKQRLVVILCSSIRQMASSLLLSLTDCFFSLTVPDPSLHWARGVVHPEKVGSQSQS